MYLCVRTQGRLQGRLAQCLHCVCTYDILNTNIHSDIVIVLCYFIVSLTEILSLRLSTINNNSGCGCGSNCNSVNESHLPTLAWLETPPRPLLHATAARLRAIAPRLPPAPQLTLTLTLTSSPSTDSRSYHRGGWRHRYIVIVVIVFSNGKILGQSRDGSCGHSCLA
jgi:hypothetical protein